MIYQLLLKLWMNKEERIRTENDLNFFEYNYTLNRPSLVSRTGNAGWTERWDKEPKRKIKSTIKGDHLFRQ